MSLNVTEKFLLLAQHPEKGRFVISGLQLQYGIIGSILLEMSMTKKIIIENDKLVLKSNRRDPNPIIAEIEEQLRNSSKPRKIRYWMNKLGQKANKYKRILLDGMDKKMIIRIERKRFVGIIPYKLHFLVNHSLRREMLKRLKREVLSPTEHIDDEDILLLGLIEACKMHTVFTSDKAELKLIKKELKGVIADSPIAKSVDETIKQVQAAILVSMIATTAVTSSH
jgi:hypothetical protein